MRAEMFRGTIPADCARPLIRQRLAKREVHVNRPDLRLQESSHVLGGVVTTVHTHWLVHAREHDCFLAAAALAMMACLTGSVPEFYATTWAAEVIDLFGLRPARVEEKIHTDCKSGDDAKNDNPICQVHGTNRSLTGE